jgi:hypothetical protein
LRNFIEEVLEEEALKPVMEAIKKSTSWQIKKFMLYYN